MWLNRRGAGPARWSLLFTIPVLLLAHHQLWAVRYSTDVTSIYVAFVAGMLIWTWHELAFYSGLITGPWREPCPLHAKGWDRFCYALGTHLYHEVAVAVEAALLWWLFHDAVNVIGALTFVLLWALQHSAKLNVLLGVRSLDVAALPKHLRYLGSFWTQRALNVFFIPAMTVMIIVTIGLWVQVGLHVPHDHAIALTLLATLLTLGVLEHGLLVVPALVGPHAAVVPPSSRADISHLNNYPD
jgi:putative photosynthetic complex assembly protein 2